MSCSDEGSGEEGNNAVQAVFGICLGIAGSFGINIGNNMQAVGLRLKGVGDEEETVRRTAAQTRKQGEFVFLIGTVIFVSASVINFVAFAFAPASILAPLESLQFVSNLLFGKFVNKVEVTRRMLIGCGSVIFGTSLAVALGPSAVFKFSIPILVDFWTAAPWNIYLTVVICTAVAAQGTNMLYTRWIAEGKHPPYAHKVLPVTFAITSALIGTQSVVQAKSLSEVVEQLGCGVPIFSFYYTYIAVTLFLTQVAVWLYRLTAALALYDPLFIIPLLQSNYILFATISGGIYFQEFNTMKGYQWAGFATGCCIMFVGLYFLAPVTEENVIVEGTSPGRLRGSPRRRAQCRLEMRRWGKPIFPRAPRASLRTLRQVTMPSPPIPRDEGKESEANDDGRARQISFPVVEIHRRISRKDLLEAAEEQHGTLTRRPSLSAVDGLAVVTGMPFRERARTYSDGKPNVRYASGTWGVNGGIAVRQSSQQEPKKVSRLEGNETKPERASSRKSRLSRMDRGQTARHSPSVSASSLTSTHL
ncbi:hypothetical protein AB1Y20_012591 [Prymnesium parvum]|uniref:Magnesium transporter n=1 Tax=Prymnesium parvum TaxID=97485 RepID=A0AB34IJ78_PRYPA